MNLTRLLEDWGNGDSTTLTQYNADQSVCQHHTHGSVPESGYYCYVPSGRFGFELNFNHPAKQPRSMPCARLPVRFSFALPPAGVRLITISPRNVIDLLTALLSVATLESNPACAQQPPPGKALTNRPSGFAATLKYEKTAATQAARRAYALWQEKICLCRPPISGWTFLAEERSCWGVPITVAFSPFKLPDLCL